MAWLVLDHIEDAHYGRKLCKRDLVAPSKDELAAIKEGLGREVNGRRTWYEI